VRYPSQAHPGPTLQLLSREMHESPQALPLLQTAQHPPSSSLQLYAGRPSTKQSNAALIFRQPRIVGSPWCEPLMIKAKPSRRNYRHYEIPTAAIRVVIARLHPKRDQPSFS
jgi:hypothetical protein